jgi:hypothetical protein
MHAMGQFTPDKEFVAVIQEGDIIRIRAMLKAFLTADPADSEERAQRHLLYARERIPELFEQHSAAIDMESNQTKWSAEYRDLAAGALLANFSEDRFQHLVEVGKHVYPKQSDPTGTKVRTMSSSRRNALLLAGLGVAGGIIILKVNTFLGGAIIIGSIAFGIYSSRRHQKK